MNLLAIDTAHWTCSVALWQDGFEVGFQEITSERNQAAFLPSLIKEVVKNGQIDQILVNIGPGSFTGIRIGIAFAKGLSMGLGIPLKGMNGFMATYTSIEAAEDVLVVLDARRPDVFTQRFIKGIPQEPQSLTREDIQKLLISSPPPLLAGNGLHPFLEGLPYKEAPSPWRGAQKLAYAFFKAPHFVEDPLPFYIREADVTVRSQTCG